MYIWEALAIIHSENFCPFYSSRIPIICKLVVDGIWWGVGSLNFYIVAHRMRSRPSTNLDLFQSILSLYFTKKKRHLEMKVCFFEFSMSIYMTFWDFWLWRKLKLVIFIALSHISFILSSSLQMFNQEAVGLGQYNDCIFCLNTLQ